MNIEQIRAYCLAKPGVTESFPFSDTALVFKVAEKMFALLGLDDLRMNLKCDPDLALELREQYEFVIPGYHMNKKHWNTVSDLDMIPNELIREWIDHSYQLVFDKLPAKTRQALAE